MKRKDRKLLKIVALTSMSIFTLFSCFSAAIAWFISTRSVNNNADTFVVRHTTTCVTSITVHQFYGSTQDGDTFGFNPTASYSIEWGDAAGESEGAFRMGKYSLDDPHHPVLFILGVNGENGLINFLTDYSFLANNAPTPATTVATYGALGTYADGTYVRVTTDENHSNATTIYQYVIPAEGDPYFEMKWINLRQTNNPLSSIVESHYVLFTDDPTDSQGTNTVTTGDLLVDDGEGNKELLSRTYVPISSTFNNTSTFVSFNAQGNPVFNQKVTVFEGSTAGYTHIGLILDYNNDALEYIYSFFLGHSYLNEGLGFKCDWSVEI